MSKERVILKKKDNHTKIASSISEILFYDNSTDVTLVSDDQIQFQAHKSVLSASSPVLKEILLENPHGHPLIYLSGIHQQELGAILKFVYQGKTFIREDSINTFLRNVKDLQLKILINNSDGENANQIKTENEVEDIVYAEEKESNQEPIQAIDMDIPNIDANSDRSCSENRLNVCSECWAEYQSKEDLINHMQNHHKDVKYVCDLCDFQTIWKSNLTTHRKTQHEGLKYFCEKCEYQALSKAAVLQHMKSVHEGIRFDCDQCSYQTKSKYVLKSHKEKHKADYRNNTQKKRAAGITDANKIIEMYEHGYKCTVCDKRSKNRGHAQEHAEIHMIGISYDCELCDKTSHTRAAYRSHKKNKHPKMTRDLYSNSCKDCGKDGMTKMEYAAHIYYKHQKLFTCDNCGKQKMSREIYNNHMTFCQPVQLACRDCGESGMSRGAYREHKKRVHQTFCL